MATSVLPEIGPEAPLYWQEACRHLMKRTLLAGMNANFGLILPRPQHGGLLL